MKADESQQAAAKVAGFPYLLTDNMKLDLNSFLICYLRISDHQCLPFGAFAKEGASVVKML